MSIAPSEILSGTPIRMVFSDHVNPDEAYLVDPKNPSQSVKIAADTTKLTEGLQRAQDQADALAGAVQAAAKNEPIEVEMYDPGRVTIKVSDLVDDNDLDATLRVTLGLDELYCFKCRKIVKPVVTREEIGIIPDPPTHCRTCRTKLVKYSIEKLAQLLWEQDRLLTEGMEWALKCNELTKENEKLKKEAEAAEKRYGDPRKVEDLEQHLRIAGSQRDHWIEEHRRVTQELTTAREGYFHPDTKSIVPPSEVVRAGIMNSVRIGWMTPVYRLHDAADLGRMVDALKQGDNRAAKNLQQQLTAAHSEIAQLKSELARKKCESTGRSRRVIEE